MKESSPWALAATATAFVLVMSLSIAVIAWSTAAFEWTAETRRIEPLRAAIVRMAAIAPQASAMAAPPPWVIAACHRQVRGVLTQEPPAEGLHAIVVASGTLYGLEPDQQRDERYRGAYARCLRSRGFSY
jgi:hypothetical protein